MQYLVTMDDGFLSIELLDSKQIAWDAARQEAAKPLLHIERLLTVHDIALILRRSESRVYELKIPCVRVGGNVRWLRSDVDSWIEAHKEYGDDRDARGKNASKEEDDICGLCGDGGADKYAHPEHWPGEVIPNGKFVHAECEDAECARAHAALSDEERERFLRTL